MSYVALYREWRPSRFEDIIEQEHVVNTLLYSVAKGRVAHAYLFCGTRGTGKTTMAHILSRAVNCLNPKDGEPCNQCEMCSEILSGSCVDVLEIDAASNNSVDNIRQIRDEVIYAPTKARRKVYIIDEVHMLSTGAFNALLKTLEEPPEHVMFILATTEPHKLPATILSRCQRFDFRRITQNSITKQILKIAESDGVSVDKSAAKLIARMSDGAMRDAISLLDQCMSMGESHITYDDVLSVVGIVNDTFMVDFVQKLLDKNVSEILDGISSLITDGRDVAHFVSDMVLYFRNLLICNVTKGQCDDLVDVPADVLKIMKNQADALSAEDITNYIMELSELESGLKWASNQKILLEVISIKLSRGILSSDKSLSDRVALIESRLDTATAASVPASLAAATSDASATSAPAAANSAASVTASPAPASTAPEPASFNESPHKPTVTVASASSTAGDTDSEELTAGSPRNQEFEKWPKIMNHLKNMGKRTIHSLLLNAKPISINPNTIGLVFEPQEAFLRAQASKPEHLEIIQEAALKITGREMKVRCIDEETIVSAVDKDKVEESDELLDKVRGIAKKSGLPLEIIDE